LNKFYTVEDVFFRSQILQIEQIFYSVVNKNGRFFKNLCELLCAKFLSLKITKLLEAFVPIDYVEPSVCG